MMTAEQLAQFFHETYERLAPWFGYKTREESAKPWANVPEQNRKLMTAVCAEVLTQAAAQLAEKEREIGRLTNTNCCGDAHMELDAAMHMLETLGFKKETQPDGHTHVWRNIRAEAAEQRLQEAQVFVCASLGIDHDEEAGYMVIAEPEPIEAGDTFEEAIGECVKFNNKCDEDLREQLRLREAELEQRDADILRYVEAVREWRGAMMDAWAKDHRATMTALLESARPAWPLPPPPKEANDGH